MTGASSPATSAVDRFLEHYFRRRPVNATFTGVHDHDDRLPDWSPEGLDALRGEMRTLRRALSADAGALPVSRPDAIDCTLADAFLEIEDAELESRHFYHRNPSLYVGEAIFGVLSLLTRDFAPLPQRLERAGDRLHAIPRFLDDGRRLLARSTVPQAWAGRALRECEGAAVFLTRGLPALLAAHSEGSLERRRRVEAGAAAALEAFARLAHWLRREARVDPHGTPACGPALFDRLLARGHRCTTRPDALLSEARDAFARARAQLDEECRKVDAGGWPAVQAAIAARHPAADDYLPAFARTWVACRDHARARDLVSWPDMPIRYVPMPTHVRDAAPYLYYLSYRSPAPGDAAPEHEYQVAPVDGDVDRAEVMRRLSAANWSQIALNHVIHHGGLGHHVQNAFAARAPSRLARIAGVDCASRIGFFSAGTLVEGWACYAVDLIEETGFLSGLDRLAHQHTRVRLLARAIVDIELHRGTMTLEAAETLYREGVGMTAGAARSEVTKNSMFPGTALMYWLGTRGIHALRAARAAARGDRFSLHRFHDELLGHGSIPVASIADLMGTGEATGHRPGAGD